LRSPIIFWGVTVLILGLSFYLRLINVDEIGIPNRDTFVHWHIAESWEEGNFSLRANVFDDNREYYRPVAYVVFGLAFTIFGQTDYSIKVLNGVLDIVNIVLIFLIGKAIKTTWVGVVAAVSYAFLPLSIDLCRTDSLYILSGTFVLLSILIFVKWVQEQSERRSFLYLSLSGFSLSLAANVESDIILLFPGYIFLIWITLGVKNWRGLRSLRDAILGSFLFCISLSSLYVIGGIFFGFDRVLGIVMREIGWVDGSIVSPAMILSGFMVRFERYFNDPLGTKIFEFVLVIALVTMLYNLISNFMKKKSWESVDIVQLSCPTLLVCFILAQTIFTNEKIDLRFSVVLLPLAFIYFYSFICVTFEAEEQASSQYLVPYQPCRGERKSNGAFRNANGLLLAAMLSGFLMYVGYSWSMLEMRFKGVAPQYSKHKEVYNALEGKVDSDNKVLVVPHVLKDRRGFSTGAYFGKNAIYINDCNEVLKDFIKRHNIRYLCIYKKMKDPIRGFFRSEVVPCYGTAAEDYNPAWEKEYLLEKILENSGKIEFESDDWIILDNLAKW